MPMIAFAGFVVEPQNADLIHDKRQPVFEAMGTASECARQFPDNSLGKSVFRDDPAFAKEQRAIALVSRPTECESQISTEKFLVCS